MDVITLENSNIIYVTTCYYYNEKHAMKIEAIRITMASNI